MTRLINNGIEWAATCFIMLLIHFPGAPLPSPPDEQTVTLTLGNRAKGAGVKAAPIQAVAHSQASAIPPGVRGGTTGEGKRDDNLGFGGR